MTYLGNGTRRGRPRRPFCDEPLVFDPQSGAKKTFPSSVEIREREVSVSWNYLLLGDQVASITRDVVRRNYLLSGHQATDRLVGIQVRGGGGGTCSCDEA